MVKAEKTSIGLPFMVSFDGGGVTYAVTSSGPDLQGFDPRKDVLDFGDVSVHGLILGTLSDGTAAIVNTWAIPLNFRPSLA